MSRSDLPDYSSDDIESMSNEDLVELMRRAEESPRGAELYEEIQHTLGMRGAFKEHHGSIAPPKNDFDPPPDYSLEDIEAMPSEELIQLLGTTSCAPQADRLREAISHTLDMRGVSVDPDESPSPPEHDEDPVPVPGLGERLNRKAHERNETLRSWVRRLAFVGMGVHLGIYLHDMMGMLSWGNSYSDSFHRYYNVNTACLYLGVLLLACSAWSSRCTSLMGTLAGALVMANFVLPWLDADATIGAWHIGLAFLYAGILIMIRSGCVAAEPRTYRMTWLRRCCGVALLAVPGFTASIMLSEGEIVLSVLSLFLLLAGTILYVAGRLRMIVLVLVCAPVQLSIYIPIDGMSDALSVLLVAAIVAYAVALVWGLMGDPAVKASSARRPEQNSPSPSSGLEH